ncbi:unnamed protein product [Paramecium sonneborni]|uniref:Uncharacterized protein n=1 Tax=Paramecium sonneborni TaxID=65129 RepID=A0A8S1RRB9_9CILI|nr:unnamed protein product [Paramecium sonneborni]
MNSISISTIIISQQQYSSQGSIFFIKNQLNEIVANSSLSFQTINKQEIKKLKSKKNSQAHSIDQETQTQLFRFIPIIYNKEKQQFLKIIKQQKETETSFKKQTRQTKVI